MSFAANSATGFGWVTRVIHWLMALALLGMLVLGTVLEEMQPGLANLWLYALHKTIGLSLLALVVVRSIWHRMSPPPDPLGGVPEWQLLAARWVHRGLYLLMFAIPLSGWVASSATGLDVMFADRWVLPALAPVSEAWENAGFAVHGALTKLLIALIVLHVAGALKRAWAGDGTVRRMVTGR
jgi:cytochrome b561